MKKEKVKALLFNIREQIIDEITEEERIDVKDFKSLIKNEIDFIYGYKVGLSQAAMILLDRIEEMFPEEKEKDEEESG